MTRPKPSRGKSAPPKVTARALMEDLNALYARIEQKAAARELAELREKRRLKRQGKRAGIAPRP